MIKRNTAFLALLCLVLAACPASAPSPSGQPSRVEQLDQRYGSVLRFGKALQEAGMIQVGRMNASGTLTDDQLNTVREYESKFHVAWEAAQSALVSAMRLQTKDAEVNFYVYFAEFSRLFIEFQELAAKLGVKL